MISRYDFAGRAGWNGCCCYQPRYLLISLLIAILISLNTPVSAISTSGMGLGGSPRNYYFPEIRSVGGAILVMASVLYPYIYMVTRIAFRLTPASLFEIALVHNKSQFWHVGLPLYAGHRRWVGAGYDGSGI